MTEALGATVGGFALVRVASDIATTIGNIKNAPKQMRELKDDLRALEGTLSDLEISSTDNVSRHIHLALENCSNACTDFRTLLDRWTKDSTQDKMFWVKRWKVGVFGQDRIKAFRGNLNDCKSTLIVAILTTERTNEARQLHRSDPSRNLTLQEYEVELQDDITRATSERADATTLLQAYTTTPVPQGDADEEAKQSRQALCGEIQRWLASNIIFHAACEEALSSTAQERTGQKIRGIRATNDSKASAGFFNMGVGEELRFTQDISDVTADGHSIAAAGVFRGFDFSLPRQA
ncbi:hypothetical protein K402DRAFT_362588 [Aulographum hederae CBS 113979]|uniref:Azaphilone pigments biosynthesis cluster protein L N-terminal domain-containing protein n=1 Tax=Aulographum hederae CBS 113979 TaxID=1176131 RepID=A0A6G1GNF6_9PEZI|nr:hypothetical protein K402DRAFT_362588 [Aulographum hederae CBS 113979]